MTRDQASILYRLIDLATQSNWPDVAASLLDDGYTASEVVDAGKVLADLAGCSTMFEAGDF